MNNEDLIELKKMLVGVYDDKDLESLVDIIDYVNEFIDHDEENEEL